MQIALEPTAGLDGCLNDPPTGGAQVIEPGVEIGLEPLVVERQHRCGRRRLHELGAGLQLGIVDDRGDPVAVVRDGGPCLGRPRFGKRDRMAALVDEQLALRQPVGDRERPVAELLGERLPDGHGGAAGLERPRRLTCESNVAVASRAPTESIRAGIGEDQEHKPDEGIQGPRPEIRGGAPSEALNRVHHQLAEQRRRERTENRCAEGDGKLSGEERDLPAWNRGVGLQGRRSRDARAEQPVDERPLALEQAPNRCRTGERGDRQ